MFAFVFAVPPRSKKQQQEGHPELGGSRAGSLSWLCRSQLAPGAQLDITNALSQGEESEINK